MLTIGKLGSGQERYYLEAVADGAEDYYVHRGEAPGRWIGGGTAVLGLGGTVSGDQFTALLTAHDPTTGAALGAAMSRRSVPGFDLTFSAPKSVSLLAALGADDVAARMSAAHDAAVLDALAYLERTASHGRRGAGGSHRIATSGFVAAAFRHRVSRAGDPNLHTHVVVANRVLGADGRWTALDARALYVQAKTAGTLYQAALRGRLRELGLSWTVRRTGLGELDDVPAEVRRAFSRRRAEIEAELSRRGLTSAAAAQTATLSTRAAKDPAVRAEELRNEWKERCDALGFDPLSVSARPRTRDASVDFGLLLGAQGLTQHASSFSERDVLRAVATMLPDGAPVRTVERWTAELLACSDVVRLNTTGPAYLGRRRRVPLGASEARYSTTELLALEQALVEAAIVGQGACAATVGCEDVAAALARRPHLSGEQVRLVEEVCGRPDAVVVVQAPAGSGKTTALGAVVDACRRSRRPVLGTTLSARAAGVLRDETGLQTATTVRFLADIRSSGLARGAVVIIDEAGQVGSRTLAEIQDAVQRAGGKLVLVGDPHQLPEVEAGGAFRGLLRRLDIVELTSNHRQREAAERERLAELRAGDVRAAMASYEAAGRVTRASTGDDVRTSLVLDWARDVLAAPDAERMVDVVMLGLTNADVEDLNERVRPLLAEAGVLRGPEVEIGGRAYRVGDHVVTRWNNRRLGVLNGERWEVKAVTADGLLLRPVGRQGADVELPASYATSHRERLQHGYAITTAVAQGTTVTRSYVLGSDATYREAGYTAASRARDRTQFYVVEPVPEDFETSHHLERDVGVDALAAFTAALQRSAAHTLALDTAPVDEPSYLEIS